VRDDVGEAPVRDDVGEALVPTPRSLPLETVEIQLADTNYPVGEGRGSGAKGGGERGGLFSVLTWQQKQYVATFQNGGTYRRS